MEQENFKRTEKKYLITEKQKEILLNLIKEHIIKNKYYFSEIRNIYFDTQDFELIRESIEKPIYKQKVRIRSYGKPNMNDEVFLEIKKKFDGVVYKRRVKVLLSDLYSYLNKGIYPNTNKQIFNEIDYFFKRYNLKPAMFISYERYSYYEKDNSNFRLTFDENIKYRDANLKLEEEDFTKKLINNKTYLMEVKSLTNMPIWFTNALTKLNIYPISFSKYGTIYKKEYLVNNKKIVNIEQLKNKNTVVNM